MEGIDREKLAALQVLAVGGPLLPGAFAADMWPDGLYEKRTVRGKTKLRELNTALIGRSLLGMLVTFHVVQKTFGLPEWGAWELTAVGRSVLEQEERRGRGTPTQAD